ncbi:GatB/YqeY domain-containing protein [Lacticaseibacillus thailandensis]|uniref:GatB/YqeY domain-containing protein n=1 Tax=Lacticaseibacillus thailandensis DSM 22698 = JCM 13996 TaxID=1423810 RepID=A0A0R2C9U8_9LACO|nr:GatB/YqeY domain-containing protein [Lacticaseibacillus thailandensis]KRM88144.1 hypothetical protein FD19_GL000433 [Lacticaseibacillus thailandensis DSM 22698 = JCM 13996]
MALNDKLMEDLKTAMKAHDKVGLNVIRSLKSALTNAKIQAGHDLSADEEIAVLSTQLKQRKESLDEFTKGNRQDLADETQQEIKIVQRYLPQPLSEQEVSDIVDAAITKTGATSAKQFGLVMKAVMPQVKGKADGAVVSRLVKAKLN